MAELHEESGEGHSGPDDPPPTERECAAVVSTGARSSDLRMRGSTHRKERDHDTRIMHVPDP